MTLDEYTTAELRLMILKHQEKRVILPAKILEEIKREIKSR